MNITILNGSLKGRGKELNGFLDSLEEGFREAENNVDHFRLMEMDLHFCTGCWSCWWKTPGRCATSDDAEQIFRSVINADLLVFASPLIAGFTSSGLKMITDRLIVLLHPYILLKNGEYHHHKRYDHYPDFGLILEKEADTDDEDIEIVKNIYDRFSINFHNKLRFMKFTDTDRVEEIVNETGSLNLTGELSEISK